jgi:hypothetical protein
MDGFQLVGARVSLVMGGVAHGIRVGGSGGVGASLQLGWLLVLLPSAIHPVGQGAAQSEPS